MLGEQPGEQQLLDRGPRGPRDDHAVDDEHDRHGPDRPLDRGPGHDRGGHVAAVALALHGRHQQRRHDGRVGLGRARDARDDQRRELADPGHAAAQVAHDGRGEADQARRHAAGVEHLGRDQEHRDHHQLVAAGQAHHRLGGAEGHQGVGGREEAQAEEARQEGDDADDREHEDDRHAGQRERHEDHPEGDQLGGPDLQQEAGQPPDGGPDDHGAPTSASAAWRKAGGRSATSRAAPAATAAR